MLSEKKTGPIVMKWKGEDEKGKHMYVTCLTRRTRCKLWHNNKFWHLLKNETWKWIYVNDDDNGILNVSVNIFLEYFWREFSC